MELVSQLRQKQGVSQQRQTAISGMGKKASVTEPDKKQKHQKRSGISSAAAPQKQRRQAPSKKKKAAPQAKKKTDKKKRSGPSGKRKGPRLRTMECRRCCGASLL